MRGNPRIGIEPIAAEHLGCRQLLLVRLDAYISNTDQFAIVWLAGSRISAIHMLRCPHCSGWSEPASVIDISGWIDSNPVTIPTDVLGWLQVTGPVHAKSSSRRINGASSRQIGIEVGGDASA